MKLSDTVHIPAAPSEVWRGLNDPELLKAAIPGCKSVEKVSDTEFKATAAVTFGPVKATFGGKVTLSDMDPPNGYRISGEGTGGAAGFAKGSAVVQLTPKDGGTDLSYEVEASVGGKIAQIGQRFIDQAAKKMADDFFGRFAEAVTKPAPAEEPSALAPQVRDEPAPSPAAAVSGPTPKRPDLLLAPDAEGERELTRNVPIKLIILALVAAIIVTIIILQQ